MLDHPLYPVKRAHFWHLWLAAEGQYIAQLVGRIFWDDQDLEGGGSLGRVGEQVDG